MIGSLRNPEVPKLSQKLRELGYDVFDSWFAAGPIADDSWRDYEKFKGLTYTEALASYAARHVFDFDKYHLDRCDMGILHMPAGRSGHLELGYLIGQGKPGFVYFDQEPERWDVMYLFAKAVVFNEQELIKALETYK